MQLDCPEQVMCVLPDTLAKLLLSKYKPDNYYPIEENVTPFPISKDDEEYYSTDTEIYWPLEDPKPEITVSSHSN